MGNRKYDNFSIWLGITIVGVVILLFLMLTRYGPDFFQDFTLVL